MPEKWPPLRIHLHRMDTRIHPWIQDDLFTPYWRFYWNQTPGGRLMIGDAVVDMTPRYFYVLPGYLRFSTRAKKPFDQFYIHFNPADHVRPPPGTWWRVRADAPSLALMAPLLTDAPDAADEYVGTLAALAVLSQTLLRIAPDALRMRPRTDPRIAEAERWIAARLKSPLGNDELAERAHMSRNGFIRLFHQVTGESPQRYARRLRLEHACELLHFTDRSIETIATQTGFADRYHFTRAFVRVFKIAPARFRATFPNRPKRKVRPEESMRGTTTPAAPRG